MRIGAPAGALAVALVSLWLALEIGGGAQALQVNDPGAFVRFGASTAQLVVNIAAALTVGPLVLAAFALAPSDARWSRTIDLAAGGAAVWTVSALATGFFGFLDAYDRPVSDPAFGSTLLYFFSSLPLGQSWLATSLLAAVLTVLCVVVRSQTGVALLVVGAVVTLVPMAQQGHAAGLDNNHDAAISSLGLHIVFAAVWLGGLVTVALAGRTLSGAGLTALVTRYSSIALVCYAVVTVSGVVNAAIRLGGLSGLATPYGALVVVKSLVLVAIGLLGAAYRLAVIRRLGDSDGRRPFFVLVGLELALMGVASGFAAALGRTPTPVPTVVASTANAVSSPAQILTGEALPPPPDLIAFLTTWRIDLIWTLIAAFLLFFYLAGVVRLRRRGDRWPLHRTLLWTAGVLTLFVLTNGGLNVYEKFLFSSHMLLHMALSMVVPLLLVPAAPVTLAMRAIHRRTDGTRGGREWLLLVVHSKPAELLANPIVAGVLFAGSLIAFYYSPLFRWATTDHVGHEWMTAHFLITGYLFVQSLVGVDPLPHRFPYPFRLMVLFATMTFHAFFGLALLNGNSLLLADWYGALGWGTSALADQRLGGGIAWSVGELPSLALAIAIAVMWSRSDERESKRRDRAADRDGDLDLNAYNDMLSRLAKTRA